MQNLKVWGYNSSWRLRIFSLSHNKMKNIFLYFLPSSKLTIFLILFTKQKDCYKDDSTSSLKGLLFCPNKENLSCHKFDKLKGFWVTSSLLLPVRHLTAAVSLVCGLASMFGFLSHGTASYYTNRCHLWKIYSNSCKLLTKFTA